MENIFQTIGHDTKVVAEDVAHAVVVAVEFPVMGVKVIETCVTDYTQLRPILTQLMNQGAMVSADVLAAVAAKGLNWFEDTAAAQAVVAFFTYFKDTVVPEVKTIYSQIQADEITTTD